MFCPFKEIREVYEGGLCPEKGDNDKYGCPFWNRRERWCSKVQRALSFPDFSGRGYVSDEIP